MKEDATTEFKSSFTDAVIESLVAFANTNGGSVYIGVDDKGTPLKLLNVGAETLQKQTYLHFINGFIQKEKILCSFRHFT